MSEYIERERIEKSFDGIYDCADLIFEPHDQCCAADDCAHCKWFETKNAIKKRILSIPAADVRPVVRASWEEKDGVLWYACSVCGEHIPKGRWGQEWHSNFCPNCGARMEEEGE